MPPPLHGSSSELLLRARIPASLLFAALLAAPSAAATLPPDFALVNVTPGQSFELPTCFAFTPSGRVLVGEKDGRVWLVQGGQKLGPILDLRAEVLSNGDRGILGIAVSPDFAADRRFFVYYTVDPDSNGVDDDDDAFHRLARYTFDELDSNFVLPTSRRLLFGRTWPEGPASGAAAHGGGALRWGRDGTLLVTTGDGAQFVNPDAGGRDAALFLPGRTSPSEDIGAYRALDLASLCGKVLRLDPETGAGLASNPYYDGDPFSVRSRVWASGARNPFRAAVRPGTGSTDRAAGQPGTLYVGDVGWVTWEDLHIVAGGGVNLGWPCREGPESNTGYQYQSPARCGCDSLGQPGQSPPATDPRYYVHHTNLNLSRPSGAIGNSITVGAFHTARIYPRPYWDTFALADFGQGWLRFLRFDAQDSLLDVVTMAEDAPGIVDLAMHPLTGELWVLDIIAQRLLRLSYTGPAPNLDPVPAVAVAPRVVLLPGPVTFNSRMSSDPEGDALIHEWSFGDGTGALADSVTHVFPFPRAYDVVLRLDDQRGGVVLDTTRIIALVSTVFPTTAVLDPFERSDGPLGPDWSGPSGGPVIQSGAMVAGAADAPALWATPFGAEQEIHVRVADPTGPLALVLRAQSDTLDAPRIEVEWDPALGRLRVRTLEAGGWVERDSLSGVGLLAGDTLGARAYSNGIVQVHRGGLRLFDADLGAWPLAAAPGRVGVRLPPMSPARVAELGGGDAVVDPDQPPTAQMLAPLPGTFFVAGDTLRLRAQADDAEEPVDSLLIQWRVDLHHNNHVHPATFVLTGLAHDLVLEDHDDGTGVWYRIRLSVSDGAGHTTILDRDVHPEINLTLSPPLLLPDSLGQGGRAELRFHVRNTGRMPARPSLWRLRAGSGGPLLAQGLAAPAAGDSTAVVTRFTPALAPGLAELWIELDPEQQVPEVSESDNAALLDVAVTADPTTDVLPPWFLTGPVAVPAASLVQFSWRADEPVSARVFHGASPLLGDSSAASPSASSGLIEVHALPLGAWRYFRVRLTDLAGFVTWSPLDSVLTQETVTGTPPGSVPDRLALSPARPNPARSSVAWSLELPRAALVEWSVHDLAGRTLHRAAASTMRAGLHRLEWRPAAVTPPGLYLVRVRADDQTLTRRVVRVQ